MNVNSTLTCKLWSGGERGTRWHPQKVRTGQTDILVCAVSVCTLATGPLAFTNGANPVKIKRCPETNCPRTRAAPCSDSELCCKHYNWWLVCSAEKIMTEQKEKTPREWNDSVLATLFVIVICMMLMLFLWLALSVSKRRLSFESIQFYWPNMATKRWKMIGSVYRN